MFWETLSFGDLNKVIAGNNYFTCGNSLRMIHNNRRKDPNKNALAGYPDQKEMLRELRINEEALFLISELRQVKSRAVITFLQLTMLFV